MTTILHNPGQGEAGVRHGSQGQNSRAKRYL